MDYLIKLYNIDKELKDNIKTYHTYFFQKTKEKKEQALSIFFYFVLNIFLFISNYIWAQSIATDPGLITDILCLFLAYFINVLVLLSLPIFFPDNLNFKIFKYFKSRKNKDNLMEVFSPFFSLFFVFTIFVYIKKDYFTFISKTKSIDKLKKEKSLILKKINENDNLVVQLIKKNRNDKEEHAYQKYIEPILIKSMDENQLSKLSKEEINFIQNFKNKQTNLIIND